MLLLIGSNTLAGQAFAQELEFRRRRFVCLSAEDPDLADVSLLYGIIRRSKPAFVVNASCISNGANGELTQAEKESALRANVLLPQAIARVCRMRNIPCGHVSSGLIFRGAKILQDQQWIVEIDLHLKEVQRRLAAGDGVRGFNELDEPNHCFVCPPCDFHSGTIALGEHAIEGVGNNYIWRPGLFFLDQHHPQNLLSRLAATHRAVPQPRRLRESSAQSRNCRKTPHSPAVSGKHRPSVPLVSVTHLGEFASACLDLWERSAPYGTYHIANSGLVDTRKLRQKTAQHLDCHTTPAWQHAPPSSDPVASESFLLESSKLGSAGITLRTADDALTASIERLSGCCQTGERSLPALTDNVSKSAAKLY